MYSVHYTWSADHDRDPRLRKADAVFETWRAHVIFIMQGSPKPLRPPFHGLFKVISFISVTLIEKDRDRIPAICTVTELELLFASVIMTD